LGAIVVNSFIAYSSLACLLASILGGGTFAALVAPVRLCFASYPSIDFATSVMVVENINARWVIPVNFA
jgi:hypothetical protein